MKKGAILKSCTFFSKKNIVSIYKSEIYIFFNKINARISESEARPLAFWKFPFFQFSNI